MHDRCCHEILTVTAFVLISLVLYPSCLVLVSVIPPRPPKRFLSPRCLVFRSLVVAPFC